MIQKVLLPKLGQTVETAVIETWRREYNEERPKKALGGQTPADYAKQLASQLT